MHDDGVAADALEPGFVEPVRRNVLVVGDRHLREAFALNAQQHDRIGPGNNRVEVAFDRHAVFGVTGGKKAFGSDQHDVRSKRLSPRIVECATRLCSDVADDRDRAPGKLAELFDQRVDVEQGLASGARARRRPR